MSLAAGEERIGELQRLEMGVTLQRLEPFGGITGAVLEFEDLEISFRLIFVERVGQG